MSKYKPSESIQFDAIQNIQDYGFLMIFTSIGILISVLFMVLTGINPVGTLAVTITGLLLILNFSKKRTKYSSIFTDISQNSLSITDDGVISISQTMDDKEYWYCRIYKNDIKKIKIESTKDKDKCGFFILWDANSEDCSVYMNSNPVNQFSFFYIDGRCYDREVFNEFFDEVLKIAPLDAEKENIELRNKWEITDKTTEMRKALFPVAIIPLVTIVHIILTLVL